MIATQKPSYRCKWCNEIVDAKLCKSEYKSVLYMF